MIEISVNSRWRITFKTEDKGQNMERATDRTEHGVAL
jgi:plasmid maintenance system killer protein